jgi:hypothetical protein
LDIIWLRGRTGYNVASSFYWLLASPGNQELLCFLQHDIQPPNFQKHFPNVTPEVFSRRAIALLSHLRVLKNGLMIYHLVDHFMAALHHPLAHILAQNTEPNRFYQ